MQLFHLDLSPLHQDVWMFFHDFYERHELSASFPLE